jgi:hypothetical protein
MQGVNADVFVVARYSRRLKKGKFTRSKQERVLIGKRGNIRADSPRLKIIVRDDNTRPPRLAIQSGGEVNLMDCIKPRYKRNLPRVKTVQYAPQFLAAYNFV